MVEEIIEFYKTHTLSRTCEEFGISTFKIQKILKSNGVKQHTRGEAIALGMMEKYGVVNASQVAEIHEKQIQSIDKKRKQISDAIKGSKIYTNGTANIRVLVGEEAPVGYELGVVREPLSEDKEALKRQRMEETMLAKYGVRHYNELQEMRERLRGYATEEEMAKRRIIANATKADRYGDANYNNREKAAETCMERYGVDNVSKLPEITSKIFLSKKRNHTVTSSKPEEDMYAELCKRYTSNGVIRQYKCDRYPFRCDFYIPSEDLFIELNAHWTHGGKPFDPNDEYCQEKLSIWAEKAKKSPTYAKAIKIWCERDVEKRRTALENNLNYITYY